jgi:hypothetical protein
VSAIGSKQAGVLIQRRAIGNRHAAHVERDPTINDASEPVGRQVVRTLLRHDDQMSVSDAVAVEQKADALERKNRAHSAAGALGDNHDALREIVADVGEVIDVRLGNHEAFAAGGRAQCHECGDGVVFVDDARRGPSCDDFAEYTGHRCVRGAEGDRTNGTLPYARLDARRRPLSARLPQLKHSRRTLAGDMNVLDEDLNPLAGSDISKRLARESFEISFELISNLDLASEKLSDRVLVRVSPDRDEPIYRTHLCNDPTHW